MKLKCAQSLTCSRQRSQGRKATASGDLAFAEPCSREEQAALPQLNRYSADTWKAVLCLQENCPSVGTSLSCSENCLAETPREASEQHSHPLWCPNEYIHCRRISLLNLALSVTPSPSLYPATLEGLRGYFINLIIIARRKLRLRRLGDLLLAMKQRLLCFMVV